MLSEIFLLTVTCVHPEDDYSFVDHLLTTLGPKLQSMARPTERVISVEWKQDPLVLMFLNRILSATRGSAEYMKSFRPEIGHFRIVVDSDYNYERRYSPWLEDAVGKIHTEVWFVGSNFFYLVNDQDAISFHGFAYLHTPNVNTDDPEDEKVAEVQDYADLFDQYFYRGGVLDDHAEAVAARLYLLAGAP